VLETSARLKLPWIRTAKHGEWGAMAADKLKKESNKHSFTFLTYTSACLKILKIELLIRDEAHMFENI
jgi:hypothetical protein